MGDIQALKVHNKALKVTKKVRNFMERAQKAIRKALTNESHEIP